MASMGRRSDDGGEPSYDRESSSHQHYQHQRRRQEQQHYHSQPPRHYDQQSYTPGGSYPHGQMPMQNQHPPGNNSNGNYNINPISKTVPVPPRMRLRKWSDMTRTIWHYERIEQIGEGTYGQVYRARCKDTNQIVAMKKIRVHYGGHWGMPPTVIREIKILKRLVHPNLVRMHEVVSSKGVEHLDADDYHKGSDRSRKKHKHGGNKGGAEDNGADGKNSTKNDSSKKNSNSKQIDITDAREGYKGNLFLVLEYVPHDLTGLLDVAYKFSEVEIKCVFRQLLEALRYMHDQKYVHRDIKSSNILIDRHFRLKLADFGLARSIEPPLLDNLHDRGSSQEFTNKVITLWYRPPELLLGATRYGFAVDIWSAGCILAELVLGRPLFTGKTEMDQLKLIFDMVGTPTTRSWPGITDLKLLRTGDVSIDGDSNRKRPKLRERYLTKMNTNAPGAINLVEKLLECDPSKRLTASRALDHRYFFQEPRAPDQPEELGEMKLAEGGSFHEFQTKKKRKEAKAQAEKIKQAALDGGHTAKQAQEEFDAYYRGIMEKVAQEGLASASAENDGTEGDAMEEREERDRGKHRSSRTDRSPEHRNGNSRSSRERDHRDSSSRGRERRSSSSKHEHDRERSRDKSEKEKSRDGAGSSKEMDSSHREQDHSKERSRSSRRSSESEDRRKKRRDREREREHHKAAKLESGYEIQSQSEKESKDSMIMDAENTERAKDTTDKKPQSEKAKDAPAVPGKSEDVSSRGEKKRGDRPRDRSRDDDDRKERKDRDREHRRRSSKDREERPRDSDRDRGSSGRSKDSKKRKSRNRSRSAERESSPGRSRDDRHHRHRREREQPRHERDRDRRHQHDDHRDSERRSRNDPHYHPDDWGPRGPPPPMQRRRDEFGGDRDFGGPPRHPHERHSRGGDSGPYGGDWGPRRGGPDDFRGPPGRHSGPPYGGRPVDYYPPGGDHPPPGYRDRDRNRDRGPRRDRDRR